MGAYIATPKDSGIVRASAGSTGDAARDTAKGVDNANKLLEQILKALDRPQTGGQTLQLE